MKKNKIIKVVLVTVLVLMLFTWIFPAAYFSGEYTEQGRIQMGILIYSIIQLQHCLILDILHYSF